MTAERFQNPGVRYTAQLLEKFANNAGENTDIDFEQMYIELGSGQVGGSILENDFDVSTDLPKTVPQLLGRLAIYDHGTWSMLRGAHWNKCDWLKLKGVEPHDTRIDHILAIVGAKRERAIIHVDEYSNGRTYATVPYTEHHYMESPDFAIQIHRHPTDATHVAIMLPSLDSSLDAGLAAVYSQVTGK